MEELIQEKAQVEFLDQIQWMVRFEILKDPLRLNLIIKTKSLLIIRKFINIIFNIIIGLFILFTGCNTNSKVSDDSLINNADSIVSNSNSFIPCDSLIRAPGFFLNNISNYAGSLLNPDNEYVIGDKIQLLKDLDFDTGKWEVYLFSYRGDKQRVNTISGYIEGCYILRDISIMKQMKEEWIVEYTGLDKITPMIFISFLKNGKLIFGTSLFTDQNTQGFATWLLGWAPVSEPDEISKYFQYFERY